MALVKNQHGEFETNSKVGRPKRTASGARIDPVTGKAGTGRPTKFTPETIQKLEYAFSLGCSDKEACFYADVGQTALYNYQKSNPEFVKRKELLKQNPILLARQTVLKGISGSDADANLALKFLERKRKDEFSLKTESENRNINQNLEIVVDIEEDEDQSQEESI